MEMVLWAKAIADADSWDRHGAQVPRADCLSQGSIALIKCRLKAMWRDMVHFSLHFHITVYHPEESGQELRVEASGRN